MLLFIDCKASKAYSEVQALIMTDLSAGKVAPRANETLELPPEICSLHMGIKGKLCRGAMRLPSVLYSLETALLAAELRDLIGIPISCFKVHFYSGIKVITSHSS